MLCDNVSEAWLNFKHLLLSVINNIAPVKEVRMKQRTEPWINSDILEVIKKRNTAFNLYKKNKTEDNFTLSVN